MRNFILSIFVFFGLCSNSIFAYELATSFQHPISSSDGLYQDNAARGDYRGWLVGQDFQDCRKDVVPKGILPCRHLGEDWNYLDGDKWKNSGRSVHATANGYVTKSGVKNGFAGYIILKHYLPGGGYVLSVYGHLQTTGLPSKGQFFKKGQKIAVTASKYEMDKWTTFGPHLHFEIRASKSKTGLLDTYLNDGYDKSRGRYYDPSDVWVYRVAPGKDWNSEKGYIESHIGGAVITVYDFWRTNQTLYADTNSSFQNHNFDAQFKIKNDGNKSVTIQRLALAIHDKYGKHQFDLNFYGKSQPKYIDNLILNPRQSYHFDVATSYFNDNESKRKSGKYILRINAKIGGKWMVLGEQEIVILPARNSNTNSDASKYIDKCISKFKNYFGNKVGDKYSCRGNSICQRTTGGSSGNVTIISIDKGLSGNKWYYYWNGWTNNPLSLSYCN